MDKYLLSPDEVERHIDIAGKVTKESKPTSGFIRTLGERVPFDTGFLPPGLRSYTQAGNHAQMVIVCPPGVNRINWGKFEGDEQFETYLVAQPWRVIIADTIDGNFFGARMFYSPTPVNSIEQPLYHQNVPNLNCKGYSGNGVGWVCLYHKDSWQGYSLSQKVDRIIERCSGVEAYNDANMEGTDGPRFYEENGKPDFTFDPKSWESKTEKEGVVWTFNEDLWIPVLVMGVDSQDRHYANGKPLTLEMAMNGRYNAHYGDQNHPKPATQIRVGEPLEDEFTVVREAYVKAPVDKLKAEKKKTKKAVAEEPEQEAPIQAQAMPSPVWASVQSLADPDPVPDFSMLADPEIVDSCVKCDDDIFDADGVETDEGLMCHACGTCVDCGFNVLPGDGIPAEWGLVCNDCGSDLVRCVSCDAYFEEVGMYEHNGCLYCSGCIPSFRCDVCELEFEGQNKLTFDSIHIHPNEEDDVEVTYFLCAGCAGTHLICPGCGRMSSDERIVTTHDLQFRCLECVELCDQCALPVPNDEVGHEDNCAVVQQA